VRGEPAAHRLREAAAGYRAWSRKLLWTLPLEANSDDFVFDNQMLASTIWSGSDIGEIACPARYFPEPSTINFRRRVKCGFGVVGAAIEFRLARWGILTPRRLAEGGQRLPHAV
jgi:hypothetical protein